MHDRVLGICVFLCIYFTLNCTSWIFGHHASRCVIDGLGSDYASPLMFQGDMGWHSAYISLGDPPFPLFCALLQLGVTAHQWPTASHCRPAPPSSLVGSGVGSNFSWLAGHWCIPQHGFGKIRQLVLKDTLQTEPQESNRKVFRGEKPSATMHPFLLQTELE